MKKQVLLLLSVILLHSLFTLSSCKKSQTTIFVIGSEKSAYDTIYLDTATTYNAVSSQCDSTPLNTADGSLINLWKLKNKEIRWVALSRDLIYCELRQTLFKDTNHWRGPFRFGDTINVSSKLRPDFNGKWVVHDCKAAKYRNHIDFLFDPQNNKPKLGIGKDFIITYSNDN
jgi:hypothetical protein